MLGIISVWLIVWLAFMFSWSWVLTIHLNWNGHKEGKPTNLGWISNIFLGGEDYHKNHHDNPSKLIMGPKDVSGKYIIPLLQ